MKIIIEKEKEKLQRKSGIYKPLPKKKKSPYMKALRRTVEI